jgi:hypothetical protein
MISSKPPDRRTIAANDPGCIVRIARSASQSFTRILGVISIAPASAIHRTRLKNFTALGLCEIVLNIGRLSSQPRIVCPSHTLLVDPSPGLSPRAAQSCRGYFQVLPRVSTLSLVERRPIGQRSDRERSRDVRRLSRHCQAWTSVVPESSPVGALTARLRRWRRDRQCPLNIGPVPDLDRQTLKL